MKVSKEWVGALNTKKQCDDMIELLRKRKEEIDSKISVPVRAGTTTWKSVVFMSKWNWYTLEGTTTEIHIPSLIKAIEINRSFLKKDED